MTIDWDNADAVAILQAVLHDAEQQHPTDQRAQTAFALGRAFNAIELLTEARDRAKGDT